MRKILYENKSTGVTLLLEDSNSTLSYSLIERDNYTYFETKEKLINYLRYLTAVNEIRQKEDIVPLMKAIIAEVDKATLHSFEISRKCDDGSFGTNICKAWKRGSYVVTCTDTIAHVSSHSFNSKEDMLQILSDLIAAKEDNREVLSRTEINGLREVYIHYPVSLIEPLTNMLYEDIITNE